VNTKALLVVTALIKVATGVALLVVPSLTAETLLGAGLYAPQARVVARVAGVALVFMGVACWQGRNGGARAQTCLIVGVLIYDVAVPVLLLQAWIASALEGPGLWPACVLYTVLALWCIVSLRPLR
jgi:hypothetical protein